MTYVRTGSLGAGESPLPSVWMGDLARLREEHDYVFVWTFDPNAAFSHKETLGWNPRGWQLAQESVCEVAQSDDRFAAISLAQGGAAS